MKVKDGVRRCYETKLAIGGIIHGRGFLCNTMERRLDHQAEVESAGVLQMEVPKDLFGMSYCSYKYRFEVP